MKLPIGFFDSTCKDRLYYSGPSHGVLVGPARRGKLASVIAPILLNKDDNDEMSGFSAFVLDPKAEAACITAAYRQKVLKQRVILLNPFKVYPEYLGRFEHGQFDPVTTTLDPNSDTFSADASNLSEGWLPYNSSERYWVDSARPLVAGVTMFARQKMDTHSLPDVYGAICDNNLHKLCEVAINAEGVSEHVVEKLSRFALDPKDNKEIKSIISTAITGLNFVSNKAIADNMRRSTFDFRDMKRVPMTVYVILPARYVMSCAGWMRTITNAWADACLREEE